MSFGSIHRLTKKVYICVFFAFLFFILTALVSEVLPEQVEVELTQPAALIVATDDHFTVTADGVITGENVLANDKGSELSVTEMGNQPGSRGGLFDISSDGTVYFDTFGDFSELAPGSIVTTTADYELRGKARTATGEIAVTVTVE